MRRAETVISLSEREIEVVNRKGRLRVDQTEEFVFSCCLDLVAVFANS